jgi:2-polyprenyl-3-methyl-5-hydroxy-6-metoxy-1,4-benzoquinol methylase
MATASFSPNPTGKPSPERIFSTLTAYQQTEALKAAIELDLFTKIAEGASDAASLAKAIGASGRGTRILADYMTIFGFLTKQDGHYHLTQDSAVFLNRKSPAYMGGMAGFLSLPLHHESFGKLAEAVRKGGSATERGDNTKPSDAMWVEFARSMGGLATPAAEFLAVLTSASEGKPVKVLDIAAGHGMFGITIARRNPAAQIVALDWPAVLAVAQENANKFGVADRLTIKPGSAFETDFGTGYDFVLLTNILHHFETVGCETLLRRAHDALKPGGKVLTLEFVPNDDRVTPQIPAAFSLVMLANTLAGDAYTFAELQKMSSNAGFAKTTLQQVPDMPQHVVISEKAS